MSASSSAPVRGGRTQLSGLGTWPPGAADRSFRGSAPPAGVPCSGAEGVGLSREAVQEDSWFGWSFSMRATSHAQLRNSACSWGMPEMKEEAYCWGRVTAVGMVRATKNTNCLYPTAPCYRRQQCINVTLIQTWCELLIMS